ncbi:cell division protein ZapE [Demequina mangrovi]|uniref:Cell division protein ZapE n=1 Tax=Demequina mangrovi TaxID=1043493 RepID=A0A1H6UJQ4_9MICO|nr:cell division protein ZapE [Demequina mangrovi]SEI88405.1 cell division protein ZapE [Demequina mangrovi]
MSIELIGRRPVVAPEDLIAGLVPPPHFGRASFDSYAPDPEHPSQAEALAAVRDFAAPHLKRFRSRKGPGVGLYLDGGFGVGKTHLLASLAHALGPSRAVFGTFVEFTNLVGALGFIAAREALSGFAVVCIDEFELDDPGDTLIMARLMRELTDAGVCVAATSNTLPDALGEGRFAADDFQREIQAVARVFTTVRIDGPDYRHRGSLAFPEPATEAVVATLAGSPRAALASWPALLADLTQVHPSRYGAYVDGVAALALTDVAPLEDQNQALRVVALVDRLYDRDAVIAAAGAPLDSVFTAEMLRGGYRKKYLRCLSRLESMAHAALEHTRPV